jgi:hypothetical protein
MLWFERRAVDALISAVGDDRRPAVERYVDGSLRTMPELLRLGIAAESLLLGSWPRVLDAAGRLDRRAVHTRLTRWETSRVGLIRQYVRALRSLVLFAEHELAPGGAG